MLPGLALVYLFGNQGILKSWLMGESIYGPIGIVMGEVFFALPHALMIIVTALSAADQRLYEAAESLRAKPLRIFWTVTLPGCRYGLVSATFVVFTLVFTDFGVPKVIGGQYNVLATDVYLQVIGQFNFQMGAVVGLLLLAPAILSFVVDRLVQRKQVALLSARAVPYQVQRRPLLHQIARVPERDLEEGHDLEAIPVRPRVTTTLGRRRVQRVDQRGDGRPRVTPARPVGRRR